MKIVEYDFKSDSHRFNVWLTESGRIEYTIDGGEVFHAKKLENRKLIFIKPQEVIKKNELFTIHYVEVPEAIYAELAQAQANILVGKEEKNLAHGFGADKITASKVDSWKKKLYKTKDNKTNKKTVYCVHDFQIGNNKYRFVERKIEGVGIVINPDYKISEELPNVGGVPKQYGELMFWDYFFQDTGWKRVREMTYNEVICYTLIKKYGHFVSVPDEPKQEKKKKFSLFRK